MADSTKFLYDTSLGTAHQRGVVPGTIDRKRAGVVRGKVFKVGTGGTSVAAGVKVTINGETNYGYTLTRQDGMFDLVVNGGSEYDLLFEGEGALPVHRRAYVPWQDYTWTPDVHLTPLGLNAGVFTPNMSTWQRVSTVKQDNRRMSLLFPPYTTFSGANNNQYQVFLVDYTRTAEPAAMPASLPPSSAFTFAAELRLAQGTVVAENPHFLDQYGNPAYVLCYVDEFLGFPVGATVPAGSVDQGTGMWKPDDNLMNGLVVNVSSTAISANGKTLPAAVPGELTYAQQLGLGNYWRVPLRHFSSVDFNWPFKLPADAAAWLGVPSLNALDDEACHVSGSDIECEGRVLGENIPVTDTPYFLRYQSDRVPGRTAARKVTVPVASANPPSSVARVDIEVIVAGQKTPFSNVSKLQDHEYTWNGRDAYNRPIQGPQPITIRVGYAYNVQYTQGQYFGVPGDSAFAINGRDEVVLWNEWHGTIGGWDALSAGFGGWTLSAHHAYAPTTRTLFFGDGRRQTVAGSGRLITTAEGYGVNGCNSGDGTQLTSPSGVAVAPDGTIYTADTTGVYKRAPNEVAPTKIITGPNANIAYRHAFLALSQDGTLFVSYPVAGLVKAWNGNTASDYAGSTLSSATSAEGQAANATKLNHPTGLAVGPDGALYIADTDNSRVLRVGLVLTQTHSAG